MANERLIFLACNIYGILVGLYGPTLLFGNRVTLNPGLGGVRDVANAIISHEQTQ